MLPQQGFINKKRKIAKHAVSYLSMTLLISSFYVGNVKAEDYENNFDVVVDRAGDVVVNSYGKCVRTKWINTNNVCKEGSVGYIAKTSTSESVQSLTRDERTVYFAFDSSVLSEEAKRRLNRMATLMKGDQTVVDAKIIGYTDYIGSHDYNEKLSLRRANTVKNYLASRGYINTSVTTVDGLGEDHPVTNCEDAQNKGRSNLIACLYPNRRVEVEVTYR